MENDLPKRKKKLAYIILLNMALLALVVLAVLVFNGFIWWLNEGPKV